MLILISSGAALYFQLTGSFYDPVKTIQELQSQNRRDEALDLVLFHKENGIADMDELEPLEKDLEYSSFEKTKSIADGAVTGRVYDTYSSIGAVISDLCVVGDVRDLGIQFWRYIKDEEVDGLVAVLSGIGIVLSAKPMTDVMASYVKTVVKYMRKVPLKIDGYLKKLLKGRLSLRESTLVFDLLKKTNGPYLERLRYLYVLKV